MSKRWLVLPTMPPVAPEPPVTLQRAFLAPRFPFLTTVITDGPTATLDRHQQVDAYAGIVRYTVLDNVEGMVLSIVNCPTRMTRTFTSQHAVARRRLTTPPST